MHWSLYKTVGDFLVEISSHLDYENMRTKYPRIPHLPWSPGGTDDDKVLSDASALLNRPLVITEKADGSNVCLEREQVFARSHSGPPRHPSFDALKALHSGIRQQIPESHQIFGEWLWAQHTLFYDRLPDYLLIFGIRDLRSECWLSWPETQQEAARLGFATMPELWRGEARTEEELRRQTEQHTVRCLLGTEQEGLVVRITERFEDSRFALSAAKWVRSDHVQTSTHWTEQQVRRNRLRA